MSPRSAPPRWAEAVIRWASRRLGTTDLPADAEELFQTRVTRVGIRAARRWYHRQALAAVARVAVTPLQWPRERGGFGLRTLETATREIAFAARRLRKAPLASASFALVVGLGVAAAAFMIQIRAAMLRPDLGLGRDDVRLAAWVDSAGGVSPIVSITGTEAWLDDPHPAAGGVVPFWPTSAALRTPMGLIHATGQRVRAGFLSALGVSPLRGRDLDGPGQVVLSHRLWRTRWSSDPGAVGSRIELGDRVVDIVGVAPSGFDGPMCCAPPEFWITETLAEQPAIARLALVGVGDESTATAWLTSATAEVSGGARADLEYAEGAPFGGETGVIGRSLAILLALALLAWLATVLSGANLVLSDTLARERELRLRRALGARPGHTGARILAETGWMTGLAAVVAFVATHLGAGVAPWLLPIIGGMSAIEVEIGREALLFVVGATATTALACSAPAWIVALRVSRSADVGRGPTNTRFASAGLGLQIGMAGTLLVVTGIFINVIRSLDGDFVGFRHGRTAVHFLLVVPGETGPTPDVLLADLDATDGDVGIALTRRLPVYGARRDTLRLTDGTRVVAAHEVVSEAFFATIGSELVAGRAARSNSEAVLSEDLVRAVGGEPASALGSTVLLSDTLPVEVVGVVQEATWGSGDVRPTVYAGWGDEPIQRAQLLIGGGGGRAAPLGDLLTILRPHGLALQPFETLDGLLVRSRVLTVLLSRLASVFGALCTLVAVSGVHAHFVRWVRSRMRALAIQSAMGAPHARLGRGIALAASRIVLPGTVLGCGVGWLAAEFTQSFLGELPAPGAGLIVVVGLIVLGASLLALTVPIVRAGRANPLELLRAE